MAFSLTLLIFANGDVFNDEHPIGLSLLFLFIFFDLCRCSSGH